MRNLKQALVRNNGKRSYWLLKTEPVEWSWDDQLRSDGGVSRWDGVRNRQAQKNLKSMKCGDLCLFYHSGRERRVIGVVEVARTWYSTADESSDDWEGAVNVRTVSEMRRAVDLREIKAATGEMKDFALLRQPRLSVVPVPEKAWNRICEMGGGFWDEDGEGEHGENKKEGDTE
ncbi:thymocyte nuclear protein 1 [Phalaenopsis equestris]|uniref:thymocyte nuclear protein 1 n=1 Tax=Phalaenopsis equestris TaxID=78828 RepID=UPI0009E38836|nr:thymocyte nuclear protein 1 [Phalaenopsis equestris]